MILFAYSSALALKGNKNPFLPSLIAPIVPPTRVAMLGTPYAEASAKTIPKASNRVGKIKK